MNKIFRILGVLPKALSNFSASDFANCSVCGRKSILISLDRNSRRNHMYCIWCHSSERKRHVTSVLLRTVFPGTSNIADIGSDSSKRVLSTYLHDPWRRRVNSPNFHFSGYSAEIPFGEFIDKTSSCQTLEALTYSDSSFDVIVTEDVLEHVRDYLKAFKEIRRVLVPGGFHIFTIPFMFDRETLIRVDTSGPEDVYLMEPEFHGTHLAYRTFGNDLFEELNDIGFITTVDRHTDGYVFISQKTK